MANWVQSYLAAHPELASLPVVKRAKHSIHFRRVDGRTEAHIIGKPCHYESSPGVWSEIDTMLVDHGTYHSPTGVPLRYQNDTVVIEGGSYSQKPARIVRLRPSTQAIQNISNILSGGTVSGDTITKSGTGWTHVTKFIEDGVRESLTLSSLPSFPGGTQPTDYICTETQVTGITFPDGWLDLEYVADNYRFAIPTANDANGPIPVRRYALNTGGIQYIYTGILVSDLQAATYPVVVDPDIISDANDGHIRGRDSNYSTAHSTSDLFSTNNTTFTVGQFVSGPYSIYRGFLKFNTISIPDTSVVVSAHLILTCISDGSDTDFDVDIVKQNWSAQDPIDDTNREAAYDNCLTGTLDNNIWRNTAGMAINTPYTSGDLDTTWVDKVSFTYYSLISSRDVSSAVPTGNEFINVAAQENDTVDYRPVLTVVYDSADAFSFGDSLWR